MTSADVLKVAGERGIEVASAISILGTSDIRDVREALKSLAPRNLAAESAAKRSRSEALNQASLEAGREALSSHLAKARAVAEKKGLKPSAALPKKVVTKVSIHPKAAEKRPAPSPVKIAVTPIKASAPKITVSPVAPKITVSAAGQNHSANSNHPPLRMAPGVKPKNPHNTPRTTNAHPGFSPLKKAMPAPSIKITVAQKSKPVVNVNKSVAVNVNKSIAVDDWEDEKGRKGKKGRDAMRVFEKKVPRVAPTVPQPGSRISVDEASREISIRGAVIVKDLAAKLDIKPNRLIADLMALKILASINQRVEPDIATKVAEKYGFKVTIEHARDKAAAKPVLKAIDADDLIPEDPPETLKPRAPVVTFLGHVDHGKTTLMDWIRKERVAAGEAGGITQQISAYQVEIAGRKITFLDTPGHAAFSSMRARGAQITDIAVLIIAADDGIMPQTEECIRVARQTGVQMMVAITKCDKPTANVDRVKQQLQKRGLTPEDWGGDIICCPVSGKTGEGVDALLENILVQAEVLELQANPARRANGFVIEAELQQGLGPCATLLVTGGTLHVGDAILIGEHFGKVRALIDDRGRRVREADPATPVKCTGLSGVPEAGAEFRVMLDEKRARTLAAETAQEKKEQELANSKASTLDALLSRMAAEGRRELNVIVKSENQGTLEAVVQALQEIKSEKVGLNVIGEGTGNVSLTDVKTAAAGKAIIVGFDIGNDSGVQNQARHDGVRINSFRIIYELIDHVKQSMLDLLPPEYRENVLGHAEIKAIYDIGKLGKIAGSQMLDGKLVAKERYRILRGKDRVWDGKVQTLRHFKDEVKEVTGQQECGVCFANYEGFAVGDVIECYALEELPRSL